MQGPPASNRRFCSWHISSQGVPSHVSPYNPELQQHKNMVSGLRLLYRFGFRGNYELYFELSRLGSADRDSLLCQPVSGNMRPKPFENIKETQCLFSRAKVEENHSNVKTGLEIAISQLKLAPNMLCMFVGKCRLLLCNLMHVSSYQAYPSMQNFEPTLMLSVYN